MDEKTFLQNLREFHLEHFVKTYGALGFGEFLFIFQILKTKSPNNYLEIGVGSGLTTVLTKMSMDFLNLDCAIYAIDKHEQLYSEDSKSTGFVLDELESNKNVNLILGKTSQNIGQFLEPNSIDICFIDGDHFHPWATIDAINVLPFMKQHGVLIFHDINLYKFEGRIEEIGPKYIFDQISGEKKIANTPTKNIGSIIINNETNKYIGDFVDSLYLPWTCNPYGNSAALIEIISKYYQNDPDFLEHIEKVFTRNGQTTQ